ncbi:MAG: hypothetical protein ACRC1P_01720 [Cellulosilyticaceae bacterium]
MINNKERVEEGKAYIAKELNNTKLFQYIVDVLRRGNKKAQTVKGILNEGAEIQTLKGSLGIARAKAISDEFCNSTQGLLVGVDTDILMAHSVALAKLKKGNILLTIKSVADIKDIVKKPSCYMKEFTKFNTVIDPQTDLFGLMETKQAKKLPVEIMYYGIIAYHFSANELLEHVSIVFFDTEMKTILEVIKVPESLLGNKADIVYEDKPVLEAVNIKDQSLKEKLKIKKIN